MHVIVFPKILDQFYVLIFPWEKLLSTASETRKPHPHVNYIWNITLTRLQYIFFKQQVSRINRLLKTKPLKRWPLKSTRGSACHSQGQLLRQEGGRCTTRAVLSGSFTSWMAGTSTAECTSRRYMGCLLSFPFLLRSIAWKVMRHISLNVARERGKTSISKQQVL